MRAISALSPCSSWKKRRITLSLLQLPQVCALCLMADSTGGCYLRALLKTVKFLLVVICWTTALLQSWGTWQVGLSWRNASSAESPSHLWRLNTQPNAKGLPSDQNWSIFVKGHAGLPESYSEIISEPSVLLWPKEADRKRHNRTKNSMNPFLL